MSARANNWCGTMQLGEEFDAETWLRQQVEQGKAKFIVGQVERGSHTHLQFYLQLGTKKRLSTLKAEICPHTHWEPARGSPEDNIKYCTKSETRVAGPWSFGVMIRPGQRTDLGRATEMIKNGASIREVASECSETFVKFHKGLIALDALLSSKGPRDVMKDGPEVWVYWGPSGVGKSRRAFEQWPDAYRKTTSDKWWDGYHGQETVIFDDFKGSSMKLHDFQTIIDRYPIQVEVKGAYTDLSASRYVFTSNKPPEEWYSKEADPEGTVIRRINEFCRDRGRLIHMEWPQPPRSWVDAWEAHTE